jgi:hypothetical protein
VLSVKKKEGRLKRREDKTLSRKESKRSVTRSKRWGFSPFFGKWQDLFAFAM